MPEDFLFVLGIKRSILWLVFNTFSDLLFPNVDHFFTFLFVF